MASLTSGSEGQVGKWDLETLKALATSLGCLLVMAAAIAWTIRKR